MKTAVFTTYNINSIPDFIRYHKQLGFDYIFVINDSGRYFVNPNVTVINDKIENINEEYMRNKCKSKNVKWFVFIPVDKKLILTQHDTINAYIDGFNNICNEILLYTINKELKSNRRDLTNESLSIYNINKGVNRYRNDYTKIEENDTNINYNFAYIQKEVDVVEINKTYKQNIYLNTIMLKEAINKYNILCMDQNKIFQCIGPSKNVMLLTVSMPKNNNDIIAVASNNNCEYSWKLFPFYKEFKYDSLIK